MAACCNYFEAYVAVVDMVASVALVVQVAEETIGAEFAGT